MPPKPNSLTIYIGLLRGINVGGHNKVPMAELRALAEGLGWQRVQTYIHSGNLVFAAKGTAAEAEGRLERAVEQRFGLQVPVVVRAAADWTRCAARNPFVEEVKHEPNHVLLALAKAALKPGAGDALQQRAADGERVVEAGDAFWIYFPGHIAKSKLTPAVLDRLAGSPVTARNWLTVLKLGELAQAVSRPGL